MLQTYNDGFFNVNEINGFLPIKAPLAKLPVRFQELQDIIDKLPEIKETPNLILEIVNNLKQYEIDTEDIFEIQALFRAYAFISSMYLLEPSYQHFKETKHYGKGRTLLPKQLSIPFVKLSEKLNVYPYLDYHYCYSLGNYVKKSETGSGWENYDMACRFSGTSDEVGFIMTHVYINELSPKLVETIFDICNNNSFEKLKENYLTLKEMNKRRREMWKASRYSHYNDFRIFIMGIKGNEEIFGDGVIYENCFDEKPQQFRGQTGAQDDIIPTEDILSGIINYYPENELTKYLLELRTYRPVVIQKFFNDISEEFKQYSLKDRLLQNHQYEQLVYLLGIIDEIYLFRNGHWQFVQKYIMSNTKYPKATGGTPIISWIPNQICACLKAEQDIIDLCKSFYSEEWANETKDIYEKISHSYNSKCNLIQSQIEELKSVDYDIELIYNLNDKLNLEDTKL